MRVRIYIDFNISSDAIIDVIETSALSNVSDVTTLTTNTSTSIKGFQLSANKYEIVSKLDGTNTFFTPKGYKGVLSTSLSNSENYFTDSPTVKLNVQGNNIDKLYITFDNTYKEYATMFSLFLDGVLFGTYENTDVTTLIELNTALDPDVSHEIILQILRWSVANASAKISRIANQYSGVFNNSLVKNFECSENSFNSFTSIDTGIIEQYADVTLYDRYKQIHKLVSEEGTLPNANIDINAVDIDNNEYSLGSYVVSDWDISTTNLNVKLICRDPSAEFDKIYVENIPAKQRNVHEMLTLLFSSAGNVSWEYETVYIQYECQLTYTPNNWFKADNLLNLLNKVCALGLLRIYYRSGIFIIARAY